MTKCLNTVYDKFVLEILSSPQNKSKVEIVAERKRNIELTLVNVSRKHNRKWKYKNNLRANVITWWPELISGRIWTQATKRKVPAENSIRLPRCEPSKRCWLNACDILSTESRTTWEPNSCAGIDKNDIGQNSCHWRYSRKRYQQSPYCTKYYLFNF